ncbi:hypothetical protein CK203_017363 [Vitis vinifera]|uniref:Uncharacterized protein n=1 Tax=Vitis vinifera TaxID=29760 RepID=A0A438JZE3_VITVI|nr:hypothetical protein CK203_017363 [Vitis vinifera]
MGLKSLTCCLQASQDQMTYLSWLLIWFEAMLGGGASFHLGLALGASHKSVAVWDRVEERFWKRLAMWKRMVFFVEDGRRVRFWKDKCGNDALCDSFPSLYALAASKEVWVAKVWDSMGEEGGWNPRSLSLSMIGRWRWWRVLLSLDMQSRSSGASFGALVFLRRWVFFLGKLRGVRF